MSVLEDILEWSADRPAWQRDALRRIVTQEEVAEQDLADLLRICLGSKGISSGETPVPTPIPLAAEHLPVSAGTLDRVQLIGLRNVQGVNALAPGHQLGFEPDGITIVFGYNGSGKSGYARVLRQLCHARHRGDRILPNAFATEEQATPSAAVDYRVADTERSANWQQGHDPPAGLGRVSFFDAECAAVHVDDANELAFTPFGLDVPSKLVNICRQMSDSINQLVTEQERARPDSLAAPRAAAGTQVRTMLDEISGESDIGNFRRLADLSEGDHQRIVELREVLGTDPAARARELRNSVLRLQSLLQGIRAIEQALASESIDGVQEKLQDLIVKKRAATVAAEQAFGNQPLGGVGEEVWQRLWEAARAYSRLQAYPEQNFPVTEDDARCVLCQQVLAAEAKERLRAFEEFVQDDTQQAADRAAAELSQSQAQIRALTAGQRAFAAYLPDLPDNRHDLRKSIGRFFRVAWKIQRAVLQACDANRWSAPCVLPASPAADVVALTQAMSTRAEELERAAVGEERQTLIHEQNDLLARQWLSDVLDDIATEIERRKTLGALRLASGDTATTGITRKSTELTDAYVTDVLRDRLSAEIRNLGADYLRVELDSPGGRLGQKRFKISLHGAPDDTQVRRVLSEGEFRCIALAGFLAELSTEQSGSGIILDDPVCSLDHQWRRKVADRLAQEATARQVIIFTHDIVFLTDLVGFCEARGIRLKQTYMRRGPNQPGECLDGVPWAAMKVGQRIGKLKNWLQAAEAIHRREGRDAYEPEARRIYGLLRETWERAVEEVLLNGVVMRFDRAIHTQQLGRISDITTGDIQAVEEGMTKSSRFLEGHDKGGAVADPAPDPDELRQDITTLEDWVRAVRQRR